MQVYTDIGVYLYFAGCKYTSYGWRWR